MEGRAPSKPVLVILSALNGYSGPYLPLLGGFPTIGLHVCAPDCVMTKCLVGAAISPTPANKLSFHAAMWSVSQPTRISGTSMSSKFRDNGPAGRKTRLDQLFCWQEAPANISIAALRQVALRRIQ